MQQQMRILLFECSQFFFILNSNYYFIRLLVVKLQIELVVPMLPTILKLRFQARLVLLVLPKDSNSNSEHVQEAQPTTSEVQTALLHVEWSFAHVASADQALQYSDLCFCPDNIKRSCAKRCLVFIQISQQDCFYWSSSFNETRHDCFWGLSRLCCRQATKPPHICAAARLIHWQGAHPTAISVFYRSMWGHYWPNVGPILA